jgi:hypothetical protein
MKLFGDRAKCFINQYTNVLDPETNKHLNGTRTFGEDLPDHAGLRAAYYAFKDFHGHWLEHKFKVS